MKKKVIAISVISVFVVGILLGILIPVYLFVIKGGKSEFNPNIDSFIMDIGDASALGISKGSAISSSINAGPGSAMSNTLGNSDNRNYMVKKKDSDEHLHKVKFKHKKTDEHGKHQGTYEENTSEELEQEDISAEIDKLYVLGDYTFISFVRSGESNRPEDADLEFATDGISTYDKCDYFTNDDRKSYIVDNDTGYIYAIVNFNIKKIQGGCLLSSDDNYIYDFRITDNDELEIYSLFTNDDINWKDCFKDKYGNKFIFNSVLNTYDSSTQTHFLSLNTDGISFCEGYFSTSKNECIHITQTGNSYFTQKYSCQILTEDGTWRNLTREDSFDIYNCGFYECVEGVLYYNSVFGEYFVSGGCFDKEFVFGEMFIYKYDAINNSVPLYLVCDSSFSVRTDFLKEYGILLTYNGGTVSYYKDVWSLSENFELGEEIILLENVQLNQNQDGVVVYGINGNTVYDLKVVEYDGEYQVKTIEYGTYTAPLRILIQPINK